MTPPKKPGRPASPSRRGAPKASVPKRKKRPRKKTSGGSLTALVLAFVVGIGLTLSALWFAGGFDAPATQSRTAASGKGQSTPSPQGKATGKSSPGKNAPAGPASGAKESPTPLLPAPDSAPAPEKSSSAEGAVASALIDLKALPYEESLNASLDERIRQADYALMQAAWLRKIPASDLRLVSVEDRLAGVEPYQYQSIDILPGKTVRDYRQALQSCLAAWAEGAVLRDLGGDRWLIVINGVETHRLRLFPGKKEFPPLPGHPDERQPSPDQPPQPRMDSSLSRPDAPLPPLRPHPGLGRHRLRLPGEPARMVIVVDDLGASHAAARQLLALDYPVTLAFWPHGGHTRQDARAAHQAGREILIHQPMEPLGYPRVRPGPNTLLLGMSEETIRRILDAAVAAVPHAVGLNNHMGSRFTQNRAGVDAVIAGLKQHGLFALDSVTHNGSVFAAESRRHGLETYQRDVFLDVTASRSSILNQLRRAEQIALLTGQSVAIGHPLPETLAALKEWQRVRNKEVRLVKLRDLMQ